MKEFQFNYTIFLIQDDHSIDWTPETDTFFMHPKKTYSALHILSHAVRTKNSTKFDEKHKLHDFSISEQVDPMVNFQDECDKIKNGADGQKRSCSHPQACPLQTEQQKMQKYKNCDFLPITNHGPIVNIPITFDKEKVEKHTQTFDKPHKTDCSIHLTPKQASYSNFKKLRHFKKSHRWSSSH